VGFFLSKTWPFWLLAALLAALIAWLLCRWWSGRRGAVATGSSEELTTTRGLLQTREAELKRLEADRVKHLEELATLRPKAAAHDELSTQLEGLRGASVPLSEHQTRVDELNSQVASLTGRVGELQGQAGDTPALQARIAELEGQAGQVSGLQARIAELEGQAGQVSGLQARIAELEAAQASRDAATPDVAEGARALGFAVAVDDLTVVEGIGPKIAGLCHDAGIHTWRQLSQTPVSRLREILDAAGPRYQIHEPGTWPKQAALLADGHWEPFKSWTDQLKGGRSAAE